MGSEASKSRRSFLGGLTGLGTAAIGLVLAIPGVSYVIDPLLRAGARKGRWIRVADLASLRQDRPTAVSVTGERTDAWLSYTFESDSLEGPGPLPESWIQGGALPADIVAPPADRRRLQYTGGTGDAFTARLHFLNGRLERVLSERWSAQLISFARFVDFRQSNDNVTEPNALGITQIASAGATAQLTYQPREQFLLILGAEGVRNDVRIDIQAHPNRAFPSLAPHTTERLRTDERNLATFAETWWALSPSLALHGSLRFDYSSLPVTDLLDPADTISAARMVSCNQDIAADGAFAAAMLAKFDDRLRKDGPSLYPRLFWETGLIGQVFYLEAEAARVRSTGIGCFFDDAVHEMIGIQNHSWQSLYHFTVGGPIEDTRLETIDAYDHLVTRSQPG